MKKESQFAALIVFLLGIFMGAIDSGIVSPARTVITNGFGVSENIGVWMITIYTLAYAVSMPIVSKLSDRYGRRKVYIISIVIFGVGSALCGLTNFYGNFYLFIGARIIQAIGGGGITPIATAVIGNSFPPEKRGTALGLVGAIYGVATILGPTLGSGILSISGNENWGWIFFINVPITIIIVLLSGSIKESKAAELKKMDIPGSFIISIVILSLMYALTNFNFFALSESIKNIKVWPFLLLFAIFLPILIALEKKAQDPVLNLKYFKNKEIALTLLISFIVGCGLMGVVFVPQFAENALRIKTGAGGYLVTLMAIFSGITAPLGGKLIDRFSSKLVLMAGFSCTIFGTLFLGLYTTSHPSFVSVLIGLAFSGFGMGFTMGTPLNYLMMSYVSEEESASALSTLSLIRSIGVTISPNIMINFVVEAAKQIPDKIQAVVPPITAPSIPGVPADMLSKMGKGTMNMSSGISSEQLSKLQAADVTTVVDTVKEFMGSIIDKIIPGIKSSITEAMKSAMPSGVPGAKGMPPTAIPKAPIMDLDAIFKTWKADYINEIEKSRAVIEKVFQDTLSSGFRNMFIAAAIIAIAGLVFTLLLKEKNKANF